MGALRDDNYFVVHGWMMNQLELNGTELLVYAILYGFTQAEGQRFTGGMQYLADWTRSNKRTVLRCLQSLCEKGLLVKEDTIKQGVRLCDYYCLPVRRLGGDKMSPGVVTKCQGGGDKMSPGVVTKCQGGGDKMSPHNELDKEYNNELDKEDKGVPPTPPPEKKPKKAKADTEAILTRYAQGDAKTLELLREWLKVRKAKRAPETEKALTLNLDKLHTLAQESGLTINVYLEAVIMRGWAAFYPIREGVVRGQAPQPTRSRVKTEEEHAAGQHASGFGWG